MGILNLFKKKNNSNTTNNMSVLEKMQYSETNTFGEDLTQLTPDGDLPFGWISHHRQFGDELRDHYTYFLNRCSESKYKSPKEKFEALKSFVVFIEDTEKLCSSLGVCHQKYFHDFVLDKGYLQEVTKEYDRMKGIWPDLQKEWEKRQEFLAALDYHVMDALEKYPGILQSDFYKLFDSSVKNDVSNILYKLTCEGKLEKTKSGRSYILNLK